MSVGDLEATVRIVSGVVSAVSSGISISSWVSKYLSPNIESSLRRDLGIINSAVIDGWVDVDEFPPECGGGYVIYVYHFSLDDIDRI